MHATATMRRSIVSNQAQSQGSRAAAPAQANLTRNLISLQNGDRLRRDIILCGMPRRRKFMAPLARMIDNLPLLFAQGARRTVLVCGPARCRVSITHVAHMAQHNGNVM